MGHDWTLWLLVAGAAVHVVEEHGLGWQGWAAAVLGARLGTTPSWTNFWATNGALIVFAVSCAAVGWRAPAFALALPALAVINASLFHLVPSVAAKRPNPGMFTATLLYLPLGAWCYVAASQDHRLTAATAVGSVLIGGAAMALPLAILRLAPRLQYPDVPPVAVTPRRQSGPRT
jgi:hypothetical protein